MLPMYYWMMPVMPWVLAWRWAALMTPLPPASASSPGAQIIPFPARRRASA